ncbi:YkvS family protein, partial [Staphylococcus aureus]|nr:YkvS family protein [Staphylococcus aureus]
MTVAEVGNIVEFMDGLRGRVEKINDNSVIVDLTIMENFNDLDLPEKTVINHKRYKICLLYTS